MWTVVGTIVVVLVTVVLGLLADRKWGIIPSGKRLREAQAQKSLPPPHAPGEAPATALPERPTRQRCPRCRAQMELANDEPVTFDGRALRVLAFACARCGHRRSVYVVA